MARGNASGETGAGTAADAAAGALLAAGVVGVAGPAAVAADVEGRETAVGRSAMAKAFVVLSALACARTASRPAPATAPPSASTPVTTAQTFMWRPYAPHDACAACD